MSILGKFKLQPSERERYVIDYTDDLDVGDSIVSATVVSSAPSIMPVTMEPVVDPLVVFWKEPGGINLKDYKITITATTYLQRIIENEIIIKIREV